MGAGGSGTWPRPQAMDPPTPWQRLVCSPRCPNWAAPPPRSGSPRRSSAARWAECCRLRPQTRRGGGQRPPSCARSAAEGAAGSPGAGARWGCVSTWAHTTRNQCQAGGILLPWDLHHRPRRPSALHPGETFPRLREGLRYICLVSLVKFRSGTSSAHVFGGEEGGKHEAGRKLPGGWPARKVAPHRRSPIGPQSHPLPTRLLPVAASPWFSSYPVPVTPGLLVLQPPRCAFLSLLLRYPRPLCSPQTPNTATSLRTPATCPPGQSLHVCPTPSQSGFCPCPHFSRSACLL